MDDLIIKRYREDEEKLMNAIHRNCKLTQIENNEKVQLEEIAKKESIRKDKKRARIETFCLLLIFISLLIIFGIQRNKEIKDCMKRGHSETFCKYAGE